MEQPASLYSKHFNRAQIPSTTLSSSNLWSFLKRSIFAFLLIMALVRGRIFANSEFQWTFSKIRSYFFSFGSIQSDPIASCDFSRITSYFYLTILTLYIHYIQCCVANLPVHESRILGNGRQCTVDPARPKIMLFERTIERTRTEAVKCKWSLGQYCSIPVYKRCRRIKLCPTKLMECKLKL